MTDRELVNAWLGHIGETNQAAIDEVMTLCASDKESRRYFVTRARMAGLDPENQLSEAEQWLVDETRRILDDYRG